MASNRISTIALLVLLIGSAIPTQAFLFPPSGGGGGGCGYVLNFYQFLP